LSRPLGPPRIVALALTEGEARVVRRALEVLVEQEGEAAAVVAVRQMLARPIAPGELAAVCGEGEAIAGPLGAPAISANGAGRSG
jgi:hypothetical protein